MEPIQPFPVWLLHFGHVLDDDERILSQARRPDASEPDLLEPSQEFFLGPGDVVPG